MFMIHNNDCLSGLNEIDISIDLTVTSPPYYNVKEYVTYSSYEEYLNILKNVFMLILEKTKDGRMCCVNLSNIIIARKNRNHESSRIPLAFHFVSLMESIGWKFIEDIIWIKPEGSSKNRNGGFYQHRQPVAYKPNVINEYILIFQKPSKKLIDSIIRAYDAITAESSMVNDGYERSNVWHINPETRIKHPAPYPEELVEKLIRYYSFVGDTVFDPYMGSGTTAVVSKKLGRNCIGFEIHLDYINLAMTRLNAIENIDHKPELVIPNIKGAELRSWLEKKPKRFLLSFCQKRNLNKSQLVSEVYEKFSLIH
jgi:DNA modification methylase